MSWLLGLLLYLSFEHDSPRVRIANADAMIQFTTDYAGAVCLRSVGVIHSRVRELIGVIFHGQSCRFWTCPTINPKISNGVVWRA